MFAKAIVAASLMLVAPCHAETWTRQCTVLAPTLAWEGFGTSSASVAEPRAFIRDQGVVVSGGPVLGLWYTARFGGPVVGYAETLDLTGCSGWVKFANPVLGNGFGGLTAGQFAGQGIVFRWNNEWHMNFSRPDAANPTLYADAWHAVSADGLAWIVGQKTIVHSTDNDRWIAQMHPWPIDIPPNQVQSTTICYSYAAGGADWVWRNYLACGSHPRTPVKALGVTWSMQLPTTGQSFAGGNMYRDAAGAYHKWPQKGTVPSDIYHDCSRDLFQWTQPFGNVPRISHRPPAYDQAADMWVMPQNGPGGKMLAFYDEINNTTPNNIISAATADIGLESLSCP